MIEVDLIRQANEVERLQCKSRPYCRVELRAQLCQSPATGCEIANLDESVVILEGDDRGIRTKVALVVHGG